MIPRDFGHGGDIYTNKHIVYDFSVNTNPLGMPMAAYRALIARADEFIIYPDPESRELRRALSKHEGVPIDYILCGNGAADLIYRICACVMPRGALVLSPTFCEYERALSCCVKHYPLKPKNKFNVLNDIIDYISADIELIFLCSPNNPTGRLIPMDLLKGVIDSGKIVVVDECFIDFTKSESAVKYIAAAPNLIILKAFTKIYAMAGLRLGYILTSDTDLIGKLRANAQPWSVSVPACIAGVAALSDTEFINRTRELIISERAFLSNKLKELGFTVYDSEANFILFKSKRPLYEPLLKKGILIRPCGNFKGLNNSYYRVGVKTREWNLKLFEALMCILD